jgi:hypothetical protein
MKKIILTTLAAASMIANPYESQKEEIASVIETGKKASSLLLKKLGGNLKSHMKTEGPLGAAKFCMTNAYPLTDTVDTELGKDVSIKRISLKYRNPANRPGEKEEKILRSLETLEQQGVILPEYLVERADADTYKFYKPLRINKQVCLKCHGHIADNKKLSGFLKENYPEDKATGYKMGDLRGAVVVTVKK